jgi:hypothetical protein
MIFRFVTFLTSLEIFDLCDLVIAFTSFPFLVYHSSSIHDSNLAEISL